MLFCKFYSIYIIYQNIDYTTFFSQLIKLLVFNNSITETNLSVKINIM
jgi:hypothetical protein